MELLSVAHFVSLQLHMGSLFLIGQGRCKGYHLSSLQIGLFEDGKNIVSILTSDIL